MELTDVASYLTDSLRRLPKGGQDENVPLRLSGRRRNTAKRWARSCQSYRRIFRILGNTGTHDWLIPSGVTVGPVMTRRTLRPQGTANRDRIVGGLHADLSLSECLRRW